MKYKKILLLIVLIIFLVINSILLFLLVLGGIGNYPASSYYKNRDNFEKIDCFVSDFYIYEDELSLKLIHENNDFFEYFEITHENFKIIKDSGFLELLDKGLNIEITSAPGYFSDGWTYPIVELKVEDKIYLEFEVGFQNNTERYMTAKRSISVGIIFLFFTLMLWLILIVKIYNQQFNLKHYLNGIYNY